MLPLAVVKQKWSLPLPQNSLAAAVRLSNFADHPSCVEAGGLQITLKQDYVDNAVRVPPLPTQTHTAGGRRQADRGVW